MTEITVNASKSYTITVKSDLSGFKSAVLPLLKGENVAVITDDRVRGIYGDVLSEHLIGKRITLISVKHGEKSKNLKNFARINNALANAGFTREDSVIALGGGVVGDLAGFVASTFMRGITLISVPTTLLSMIDSSVGGKTAVDLKAGKNLCGTFYQPSAVYIALDFLKTLPEKEKMNGLGEAVKYAFLSDTVTADMLKNGGEELIAACLKIKRDVVEEDEKEHGKRAILNFGHTVGHAIEKLSGYKLPHGLCVAKGMLYAIEVSKTLYDLDNNAVSEMKELLACAGHDLKKIYPAKKIESAFISDKKRRGDKINFVAVKKIGCPVVEKMEISELGRIIEKYES